VPKAAAGKHVAARESAVLPAQSKMGSRNTNAMEAGSVLECGGKAHSAATPLLLWHCNWLRKVMRQSCLLQQMLPFDATSE